MSRVFSVGDRALAQRSLIPCNTPNSLPIADVSANYDFLTIRCRWAGCIFMQSEERTIR